jgi:NAD-specific glutamate dehydrogenase
VRRQLAEKVLAVRDNGAIDRAVATFFADQVDVSARLDAFLRDLATEGISDLAQFTVALRQIRTLLG